MLKEREELIKGGKKENIDELYKLSLNRKFFDREEGISTEGELLDLDTYIEHTGTEDEFIYDLIRFRLSRSEMTDEQINNFIDDEKEKAAKIRKIRNEEQQDGILPACSVLYHLLYFHHRPRFLVYLLQCYRL